MKTLSVVAAALIFSSVGCSKTPEPRSFLDSWNAAVRQKNVGAVWGLFDKGSQNRVLAAWQKSQARAATDKDFQRLLAAMNPSLNLSKATAELAQGALARQLGGAFDPNVDVRADSGATTLVWHDQSAKLHLEDGQWRVAVDTAGFMTPDGAAVALAYAWPVPQAAPAAAAGKPLAAPPNRDSSGQDLGQVVERSYFETTNGVKRAMNEAPDTAQPALNVVHTEKDAKGGDIAKMSGPELDSVLAENRLIPDALDGFRINVDINGTTAAEVQAGYGQIAQRLAQLANLPPAYADQAARLMFYYEGAILNAGPDNTIYDVEFAVGTDGSLTPVDWHYDRESRSTKKQVLPRLAFVRAP